MGRGGEESRPLKLTLDSHNSIWPWMGSKMERDVAHVPAGLKVELGNDFSQWSGRTEEMRKS